MEMDDTAELDFWTDTPARGLTTPHQHFLLPKDYSGCPTIVFTPLGQKRTYSPISLLAGDQVPSVI